MMRAGKPTTWWISPCSEPKSECCSNTVHTCESLLHYAVTLRQNAQVSMRPKAWICGRWLAGIAGSNSVWSMDVSLL